MSLERNETARRFMEALLHAGEPQEIAKTVEIAVGCTDALLAALVPVAPASGAPAPLPGAPLAAPSRPEWVPKVGERVRVTRDNANHASVKAGDEYVVTSLGWDPYPETEAWGCGTGGTQYVRVCNLEPCAAPSPAATPAAWVPSVGDVVGIDGSKEYDETRVVTKIDRSAVSFVRLNANGGVICDHTTDVSLLTYLRPATSSERAAAGLPVDESAVDRVALAKVLWEASREVTPAATRARPWDEATEVGRRQSLAAADAAIAFMAKGCAS